MTRKSKNDTKSYNATYYAKNKEKISAKRLKYYQENTEKYKSDGRRRSKDNYKKMKERIIETQNKNSLLSEMTKEEFKEIRLVMGIPQEEFGVLIGFGTPKFSVNRIETGKCAITRMVQLAVARIKLLHDHDIKNKR